MCVCVCVCVLAPVHVYICVCVCVCVCVCLIGILLEQVRKSGWLQKRGGRIQTWHKRWFVLTGDMIFYYKNQHVSLATPLFA